MKVKAKKKIYPYLFLAPSFIGVGIFILIPFFDAIRRSFFSAIGGQFTGFDNYKVVLTNEAFILAAKNTARFMAICIPLLLVISLLITLLISTIKNRQEVVKACFLIPMAIPVASIVVLWKLVFEKYGLVNAFLHLIGSNTIDFMNTGKAFNVLVITYLWKNSGYDIVLWVSGLSSIPVEYYEAAKLDGAGAFKQFYYITLPCLRPTFFITIIISVINAFKVFREAYLIAGNYPHESIYMLQHIFNNWFISLDIQKMCAGAVLMTLVMLLVILVVGLINRKGE